MNSFEKLIRQALARQDASSANTRAQVYESARSALNRTMADRADLPEETVAQSKKSLEQIISQIEAEYRPRTSEPPRNDIPSAPVPPRPPQADIRPSRAGQVKTGAPASSPPVSSAGQGTVKASPDLRGLSATRSSGAAAGSAAPSVQATPRAPSAPAQPTARRAPETKRVEPGFAASPTVKKPEAPQRPQPEAPVPPAPPAPSAKPSNGGVPVQPVELGAGSKARDIDRRQRVRKLRGPKMIYSWILSLAVLIGFVVLAGWWVTTNGILEPAENRDTAISNPPGTTDGAVTDDRDWINVVQPSEAELVAAQGANQARIVTELDSSRLQLTFAPERVAGGDFLVQVGEGILREFAGRTVVFDIAMRGEQSEVPIALECDFGAMGGCGRKRYTVPLQPASMVFEVPLPAVEPGGPGLFRIAAVGLEGQSAAINIEGIRVAESLSE